MDVRAYPRQCGGDRPEHRQARRADPGEPAAPEQDYRASIGILRLARHYGADRMEAACDGGLDIGARSYGSIQSILKAVKRETAQQKHTCELRMVVARMRGTKRRR